MKITAVVRLLMLAGFLAIPATSPHAGEEFPSHVVKLIVPGLAGGGIDIVARLVEPAVSRNLGQRMIVDDRPGGNATVGAALVAHAAPDGYTILISTSGPIINALGAEITYDADASFQPISRVMASPFFLVVPQNSKFRTVAELVAAGKDPSQIIRYGHPGPGTATHLATALLDKMAGTHFVGIPYHGAAGQANDTINGQLQFGLFAAPDALSRRDSGFRILAASAPNVQCWHQIFPPSLSLAFLATKPNSGTACSRPRKRHCQSLNEFGKHWHPPCRISPRALAF